jgi:hypothetical protein
LTVSEFISFTFLGNDCAIAAPEIITTAKNITDRIDTPSTGRAVLCRLLTLAHPSQEVRGDASSG